jgi:hypothetical protein
MNTGVYQILNLVNGKRYIGRAYWSMMSSDQRKPRMMHLNSTSL